MWLYMPSLSSQASEDSTSESSSQPTCDLWVTLSGKPAQRPLSWRGWKTRPWIALLLPTISRPSMADRCAEQWISSLADSPVRTSLRQVLAKESSEGTAADSGTNSPSGFAKWDPISSSWRTCQESLVGDSTSFSGTWPTSGSMRNGLVSERPRLEPRTAETAGSSSEFPTPSATTYGSNRGGAAGRVGKVRHGLESLAKQWAKPTAGDAKSAGSRNAPGSKANMGTSLTDMVRTGDSRGRSSPTPAARDEKGANGQEKQLDQLPNFVKFQFGRTPEEMTEARTRSRSHQDPTTSDGSGSASTTRDSGLRLNPDFVDWMLGFPLPGWTDSAPLETASFRCRLESLSRALRSALDLEP